MHSIIGIEKGFSLFRPIAEDSAICVELTSLKSSLLSVFVFETPSKSFQSSFLVIAIVFVFFQIYKHDQTNTSNRGAWLSIGMGKNAIDYYNDNRSNNGNLASLDVWDTFLPHLKSIQEAEDKSLLETFAKHAPTIYEGLKKADNEAKKHAVILARHERLTKLFDMYDNSNKFDFWLIKYPAWMLSNFIYSRQERKQNV